MDCSEKSPELCASCHGCSSGFALEVEWLDEWVPSLCPVCFQSLLAHKTIKHGDVYIEKACAEHGYFESLVWHGAKHYIDFGKNAEHAPRNLEAPAVDALCPGSCGLCNEHEGDACIAVIEITQRCDLACPVCFASAGQPGTGQTACEDVSFELVCHMIDAAVARPVVPAVQLSGGEPSLHPDILRIVAYAKSAGVTNLMLNTNGLRLAQSAEFASTLKDAGLDVVYLQFDSTDDACIEQLRGRALLAEKKQAIANCAQSGLAVVLVPTLVEGINADQVESLIDFASANMPTVKGVHFQPATFFGRFDVEMNDPQKRVTLSDVIFQIEDYLHVGHDVMKSPILPRKKFDAHCSFSATFLKADDGTLVPVGGQGETEACCADAGIDPFAKETVDYLGTHWRADVLSDVAASSGSSCCVDGFANESTSEAADDSLGQHLLDRTLTLSGMHFQDAETFDINRVKGCCVFVIDQQGRSVPLCVYYLTSREGKRWDYAHGA